MSVVSEDVARSLDENQDKVDLVSELPPELVLRIFLYLLVDDVIRCSLVNKRWNRLVCDLDAYFRNACVTFGLSSTIVYKERRRYANYRALLVAARRQRLSLTTLPLTTNYVPWKPTPFDVHYEFNTSDGNLILRTHYKDFKPVQTTVERVTSDSLTQLHVFRTYAEAISENRVIWACMNSNFILYATASGIWTGYDLSVCPAPNVYRWRMDSLYDSGLTVGCCAKCFLVLVGTVGLPHPNDPKRPSTSELCWRLKVITLGRSFGRTPRTIPWHVTLKSPASRLAVENGQRSICVLPYNSGSPSDCSDSGFCRSHLILHQLVDTVTSYILTLDPPTLTVHRPLQVPIVKDKGRTLDVNSVVSCDKSLVAFLCGHHLHVSDVQSCVKQSAVTIDVGGLQYDNMKLLALGHVYSLIGLEPYDTLLVVSTQTGTVIAKHCNFAIYGGTGPHRIEFLCVVDTLWLDDISHLCSKDIPTVLYWNCSTRCVMGIHLGQDRQDPPTSLPQPVKRRKGWWRR